MPTVPNGDALRRPLRSCAIGAVVLLAILTAWQFLIPGDHSNPLAAFAFIIAFSICLSSGVGLPVSATRRLWRSAQRGRSVLPALVLVGALIALPWAAAAADAHELILLGSWLLALLLSSIFSAYLIVTAKAAAPISRPPADVNPTDFNPTDFNTDEPDAYTRNIHPDGEGK